MYGLVQAAKNIYDVISMFLTNTLGFYRSETDPFIFRKQNVILGIYVDDILMTRPPHEIKLEINKINHKYSIREQRQVDEYIGCEIKTLNKHAYILHQSKITTKLLNAYTHEIENVKSSNTPMGTHLHVTRNEMDNPLHEENNYDINKQWDHSYIYLNIPYQTSEI